MTSPISTDAAWLGVALDHRSAEPRYLQLYGAVRDRILAGAAPRGAQLPPSRVFAAELGVSRATVTAAYDQLMAEGYVAGRQGAGMFVSDLPDEQLAVAARPAASPVLAAPPVREEGPRPFRPGAPDLRLFPHDAWGRIVSQVWRRSRPELLADDDPFGSWRLRAAIAGHLAQWRGLRVSPGQIIITAGAAGGLELTLDAFAGPGDRVAIETPGYLMLPGLVRRRGLEPWPVEVDAEGVVVEALRAGAARLAVLTPSHQFPLGVAMSVGRRRELLAWAADTGAVVVEDDYDSEFRYAGRPLPALASISGAAPVVYVGTFSKVFWTGLRIGYIAAPPDLVEPLRQAVARAPPLASVLAQEPLAAFIESGEFARHLRRMRRAYAERRRALLALLGESFDRDELEPLDRPAGMQVVCRLGARLAARMSDTEAAARARAAGVQVAPLSRYHFAPPARQGLIVGFAAFTPAEMGAAMPRLREALS